MRGSFGDVRSVVRLRESTDGWKLDRGGVRADAEAPTLPDHRGLRIEGTIDRFVLDDWLALRGDGSGKRLSDYLQAANVHLREFDLFGYRCPDLRGVLQATQFGLARRCQRAGNAEGQILVPEDLHRRTTAQGDAGTTGRGEGARASPPRSASRATRASFPACRCMWAICTLTGETIGAVDLKAVARAARSALRQC